ncbi:glycosyl hydrolase [Kineococcus sp. SYSU DK001]|uniref:glycosyl hydrolase n=1 Tax=Kineococcus sp. SYSU DK001 TaxID=3383122 RepID=UPI003D7DDC4F
MDTTRAATISRRTAGAAALLGLTAAATAGQAQAVPLVSRTLRSATATTTGAVRVRAPRWAGEATGLTGTLPLTSGRVDAAVVAVRDARGASFDVGHVGPTTLRAGGLELSGWALLPAGRYTTWLSHLVGGRWVDQPRRTFDVPAVLPTAPRSTTRRSGAYIGWPQTPQRLAEYGRLRGRAVQVAGFYFDHRRWEWIEQNEDFFSQYGSGRFTAPIVLSVPLLADPSAADPAPSTALGAAGRYDGHFRTLARNLAARGLGGITIRLGWEANSPGNYLWSAVPDPAAYRAFFRRVVGVMRAQAPALRFDWSITAAVDGWSFDFRDAYPGDDVVDVVGIDVYDMSPTSMTSDQRWAWYQCARGGLNDIARFATAHGKRIGIDEWAVASRTWNGGGDDPLFVERLRGWMDQWGVAHEIYNEMEYPYSDGRLFLGTQNPKAAAEYREGF